MKAVMEQLRPSPAEVEAMAARVARIEAAAQVALDDLGVPGHATIQGSLAKGTWLAGSSDMDMFLLLDESVPEERLETIAREVATTFLTGVQAMYAQHPYVEGEFEGMRVDVVPAYAVTTAEGKRSAVDRTPFHTAWVQANLDDRLLDDVRLLKRWMKGVGVYGAETAIGGFSGYLVEVLIQSKDGFDGVLAWLAGGAQPRKWHEVPLAALQIADPVDGERNVAAAVQEDTLERAVEAAQAYLAHPAEVFFFPPNRSPATPNELHHALGDRRWYGIAMQPKTDRLDMVFPQFQRAGRVLAKALADGGWSVRTETVASPPLLLQFVVAGPDGPATVLHKGPRGNSPNAPKFLEKWPDARLVDGGYEVDAPNPRRTPLQVLEKALAQGLGKHIVAADKQFLTAPEEASAWSPAVSDFILQRRPWQ